MKSFKNFVEEIITEKNTPTQPEKWAQAKAAAKSKFAVYPSAYANAWASKKYKSMGGGWRATKEEIDTNNLVSIEEEADKEDTITVDIPLMIRLLEYAREDAKTDMDLHKVTERLIEVRNKGTLTMADYEYVSTGKNKVEESAAWQRKEGKRESGGLNQKGVDSYRREHPGSKLKTAVTTEPSKLDPKGKAAKRRKSFCSRMKGMKAKLTSAKTARDPDSRINKSLRKWNCN